MISSDINPEVTVRKTTEIALVISSFQPTAESSDILRIALSSIEHFTNQEVSVWVVDVGSPKHKNIVGKDEFDEVNFIVTDHTPLEKRSYPLWRGDFPLWKRILGMEQPRNGSYANGWTLELACSTFRRINYEPKYMMTLQMDVMATADNWLEVLLSGFDKDVIAVGVLKQLCFDKSENILHSLGCIWDYKKKSEPDTSFMPAFPNYDVGEKAIVNAKKSGFKIKALRNTYSEPTLVDLLDDRFKNLPGVDRALDDKNNVVFMHLGRGIPKSDGTYWKKGKTTVQDWISFYQQNISISRKDFKGAN